MKRIVVLGGGISGLSAAFELQRAGLDVHLLESRSCVGGCIGSTTRGEFRFENGATSIQGENTEFRALCSDLSITSEILEANPRNRERLLYYHGALNPLPRTFRQLLASNLFTKAQKLRVLLEPLIPGLKTDHEETVAEFFGRRVGRGLTMTWIDVLVAWTYAGNPNRLGIQSAFPDLARMEAESGSMSRAFRKRMKERRKDEPESGASPMLSLKGGLSTLTSRLGSTLEGRLHLGGTARSIRRSESGGITIQIEERDGTQETLDARGAIVALPAPAAGILLGPVASDVADLLFEIECASIVVAQAAFSKDSIPGMPAGYGFLAPRCMRLRSLGWIFHSELFGGGVPYDKAVLNGFIGGILDPHVIEMSDAALKHLVIGELALALNQNRNPEPLEFGIVRWNEALPQYNVGHRRRVGAAFELLRQQAPELVLAGNWVSGVSVESCIGRGRESARELLARMRSDNFGGTST